MANEWFDGAGEMLVGAGALLFLVSLHLFPLTCHYQSGACIPGVLPPVPMHVQPKE